MNKNYWKNPSKLNNQFNGSRFSKPKETSAEWWKRRRQEEALEKERRLKEEKEQEELKKHLAFKKTMDDFMLPRMVSRDGRFVLQVPKITDWSRATGYSEAYPKIIRSIEKHIPDLQYHPDLIDIDVYANDHCIMSNSNNQRERL